MRDKKFLLGLGLGIVLTTIIMFTSKYQIKISDAEVEKRALKLGMTYENNKRVNVGDEK
ncbi:hypothetical protein [Hathewaya proteolytica]|uniref:hypothetical protein n=1 Tax=Hathewaya proteolytica TaxID=29365 RepID=UPI0015B9A088|nr:hypothetical protein [Hathewaya proteolytica]